MPACFSSILKISPKRLKLTALLILSPLFFHAQSLTGLWVGALSNDSTTVRKDQSFEIALTEYKGKVYGYSRSEFIVDDVLYYIVKRVKGTIEGDICEVKDDEIIAYNFPTKLDKGVKVTSTFRRNKNDSTWYLDGTWKTNQTKKYYMVSGKVALAEEKDLNASKIFPHLEELKLANDVAFYKEREEQTVVARIVRPERNIVSVPINTATKSIATSEIATISTPVTQTIVAETPDLTTTKNDPAVFIKEEEKKNSIGNPKNDITKINPSLTSTVKHDDTRTAPVAEKTTAFSVDPVKKTEQPAVEKKDPAVKNPDARSEALVLNKPDEKKVEPESFPISAEDLPRQSFNKPVVNTPLKTETKNDPVVAKNTTPKQNTTTKSSKPASNEPVVISIPVIVPNRTIESNETWNEKVTVPPIPPVKTSLAERNGAAVAINSRKTEVSQVVNFKSDSLELALYDNGQVDGDTVSVLMNGEVILAKQGLKATAIKKTIYITPGKEDEFTLVLYAENLGAYPPNTGLLVVHDGEDVYNLRFSSDFQKNAGIVFRRKK